MQTLRVYAAAMKVHFVIVDLSEHELGFMANVLEDTLHIEEALLARPEPGTAKDATDEAPLWQQLEPQPPGTAADSTPPSVARAV